MKAWLGTNGSSRHERTLRDDQAGARAASDQAIKARSCQQYAGDEGRKAREEVGEGSKKACLRARC